MMDARAAKLALARQKLKNHQEKKLVSNPKDEGSVDHDNHVGMSHSTELVTPPDIVGHQYHSPNTEAILTDQSKHVSYIEPFISNHNGQDSDLNASEILISSKRNLELQVGELQVKLSKLEDSYILAMNDNDNCKQQINSLQHECKILQDKFGKACEEIAGKEKIVTELNTIKYAITDENNNLQEQLEFAKSMLTAKESENSALSNELRDIHKQLDAAQLQLQQLTNGSQTQQSLDTRLHTRQQPDNSESNIDFFSQKMSNLELQLKALQKEKEQITSHYEHYVNELNEQLKLTLTKNHELSVEVQNLSIRENNLIEQISDMEIRIQNMKQQPLLAPSQEPPQIDENKEIQQLQRCYDTLQVQFQKLSTEYQYLQQELQKSEAKVKELSAVKPTECDYDNLSLSKLNADIASDKIAAQKATEQNKKLKIDLQQLEEAFVKISRDKLELTEKVAAEKYLNRELTMKLAEVEEKAKDMHVKLFAKDEEMIRLQNNYRELEREVLDKSIKLEVEPQSILEDDNKPDHKECELDHKECTQICNENETLIRTDNECEPDEKDHHKCLLKHNTDNNSRIRKEDAMEKLQGRFLKIMEEVADLSDEKHRLEHIILQLQNETDTICEYVALYQQQRSLLKKRDEERSAQIKLFQTECDLLKSQLEELSNIIIRLAQDTELAAQFQKEPRQSDLLKVMNLLYNLKNSMLIDPHRTSSELNNFYPCSCCSGSLINV